MATPPDFTAGAVLTANQMDAVGLWLVKTQAVGTGVSSVTVTDAFSADYDNYLITLAGGSASADGDFQMTLGATASGYYFALPYANYSGGSAVANTNNGASWQFVGSSKTTLSTVNINVFGPFLSNETAISGIYIGASASGVAGAFGGFLNNTTSYTSFTLTPNAGTITGGTIRVYGYRN
jgi:hypothetical protein